MIEAAAEGMPMPTPDPAHVAHNHPGAGPIQGPPQSESSMREEAILGQFQSELGRLAGQLAVERGHRLVDKHLWERKEQEYEQQIHMLSERLGALEQAAQEPQDEPSDGPVKLPPKRRS